MNNRSTISLYAGVACVLAGLILYVYSFHLYRVYYYADSFRSAVSSILRFPWNDETGPPNRVSLKIYRYAGGAGELTHSGRFLFFTARSDTTLARVARDTIEHTSYYSLDRCREEIRKLNGLEDNVVSRGTMLLIPGTMPPFMKDPRNSTMPRLIFTKGLYYTGRAIGRESTLAVIDKYRLVGINAIVFDAKDITGILTYRSSVPMAIEYNTHDRATIGNIKYLIRHLKERGIYIIARIAVFHDHALYRRNPLFAIRGRNGNPWNSGSGELWCDPTNRRVQDYSIELAEELADMGVDEIQFDYVRFPTTKSLSGAALANHFGVKSTEETITDFLKRAHDRISAKNARLSIDIFGIVAWGKNIDIRSTGQRIELLSRHCDVISPMLYPSHFNDDFDGFSKPGDNPYHFIYQGCKKVAALAGSTMIRPWLQAFRWRTSNYNEQYIIDQVKASNDAGALGYLFWNAANNYEIVYRALANGPGKGKEPAGDDDDRRVGNNR